MVEKMRKEKERENYLSSVPLLKERKRKRNASEEKEEKQEEKEKEKKEEKGKGGLKVREARKTEEMLKKEFGIRRDLKEKGKERNEEVRAREETQR